MKGILLVLPFLSILLAAIGAVLRSQLPEIPMASMVAFGFSAFLLLAWLGLEYARLKVFFTRKGAKYGASSGLVALIVIGIIVTLGVLSNRPRFNKSHDVTRNSINTLSDQSLKILDQLKSTKETIEINAYFNDPEARQNFKNLIHLYTKEGADIRIEYWDTDQHPARVKAAELSNPNTVIIKRSGKESRLSTFTEEKVTSAFVAILKDKSKKIYFTSGHGESELNSEEAEGISFIVGELKKNQYEIEALNLLESARVPEEAAAVFIVGAKYDFKEEEGRFIDEYLKKGGALFVLADALTQIPRLNSLLEKYGFKFAEDFILFNPEDPRAQFFGQNNALVTWFDEFNPVTRDFAKGGSVAVMLPNARSIEVLGTNDREMKVETVAKTSDTVVRVRNVSLPSDLQQGLTQDRLETGEFPMIVVASGAAKSDALAELKSKSNDEKMDVGSSPGEGLLNSEKPIRIVAVGSSHLGTNAGLSRGIENMDLFLNAANFLVQDEDLIAIRPKEKKSASLDIANGSAGIALASIKWIYPILFLMMGIYVWVRRRAA